MADVIKSYLVSLSTSVDQASFNKFAATLTGTSKMVSSTVGGIAGDLLKFQVAGTTAFATVGFGIVAYIDKLGQADLKTKLLATQNMMSVQQYRAVSSALDVLGVTLNDVFFGTKELQDRFHILIDDQKQLAAMAGPNFENQMQQVRDVTFQLQRLELKGQYFGMKFASDLLEKLGFGKGGIVVQLEKLNDFVMANMPRWSDELTTDIIPVLKDFYDILRDTGSLLLQVGVDFTHMIGDIAGDQQLANSAGSFHDFARAIEDVSHWVAELLHLMLGLERVVAGTVGAVVDTASGVAYFIQHDPTAAKAAFNSAADRAVLAAHGFEGIGAVLTGGDTLGNPFAGPSMPSNDSDFMRLIHGVAQVESGNRQTDRYGRTITGPSNPSGELAIGRMQLLPSTARMLGVNPYDAAQNLEGGERYLAQLLTKHRGDVGGALAEYGGAKSQYSPQGQDYIRKVEAAAGISVGSIIVNVPPSALTPQATAQAVKKGVQDGLSEHTRQLLVAHSGAYQ